MPADQVLPLPRASWELEPSPISRVTLRRECRKEMAPRHCLVKMTHGKWEWWIEICVCKCYTTVV